MCAADSLQLLSLECAHPIHLSSLWTYRIAPVSVSPNCYYSYYFSVIPTYLIILQVSGGGGGAAKPLSREVSFRVKCSFRRLHIVGKL